MASAPRVNRASASLLVRNLCVTIAIGMILPCFQAYEARFRLQSRDATATWSMPLWMVILIFYSWLFGGAYCSISQYNSLLIAFSPFVNALSNRCRLRIVL